MAPPAETKGYKFNHTMIRVKDPKASLHFYQNVLGMTLLHEERFESFTLYFLGYVPEGGAGPSGSMPLTREGVLELTHNHGTESDAGFAGYASGNSDPGRGFGHIAISVPDIQACCARLEALEVPFKKRLSDGKMHNIAFVLDPDGYWIEIVPHKFD